MEESVTGDRMSAGCSLMGVMGDRKLSGEGRLDVRGDGTRGKNVGRDTIAKLVKVHVTAAAIALADRTLMESLIALVDRTLMESFLTLRSIGASSLETEEAGSLWDVDKSTGVIASSTT